MMWIGVTFLVVGVLSAVAVLIKLLGREEREYGRRGTRLRSGDTSAGDDGSLFWLGINSGTGDSHHPHSHHADPGANHGGHGGFDGGGSHGGFDGGGHH